MNKAERFLLNEKLDEIYSELDTPANKGEVHAMEAQSKISKLRELLKWI